MRPERGIDKWDARSADQEDAGWRIQHCKYDGDDRHQCDAGSDAVHATTLRVFLHTWQPGHASANGIFVAGQKLMKRCALLVTFVVLAAMAPAQVQSSTDPSGAYQCDGVSPDGKSYRAAVEIVRNGDTYVVRWLTPRGIVNVGVGVVSGNTLSVGYVGATAGVVVYTLDGKQLTGKWTDIDAIGHVYTETLTRLADGEKVMMPKGGSAF